MSTTNDARHECAAAAGSEDLTQQKTSVRGKPKSHRGWKHVQTKFVRLRLLRRNHRSWAVCRKSSLASRPASGAARNAEGTAFKARQAQRAALQQAKAVAKADADARAAEKEVCLIAPLR